MDGMGMASGNNSIFDHCSISWTIDEAFSSRSGLNITLQRTLISEALNEAGHKNYPAGTQHGYAASIGGEIGSFHHNLLAHCAGRNWSLAGGLTHGTTTYAGRLDIRNNVVYNWRNRTTDGGAHEVNFVNNYYKPGAVWPAMVRSPFIRVPVTSSFDLSAIVPEVEKTTVRGPVASTAARRLPAPLSLRFVTSITLPPRPPLERRP